MVRSEAPTLNNCSNVVGDWPGHTVPKFKFVLMASSGPVAAPNSKLLRPYVPIRNSDGLTLESSATAVTSTVGKPSPRTRQVAPSLVVLKHAAIPANDHGARGRTRAGSIATAWSGRSGKPSVPVPLISVQCAPRSEVMKMCLLGDAPEIPG